MRYLLLLWTLLPLSLFAVPAQLTFSCRADNDLYATLVKNRYRVSRFADPMRAVEGAAVDSGVLILADGYPERTSVVEPAVLELAASKRLRLYIEYPEKIPGLNFGTPRETTWERTIVTSDAFGSGLPKMRIMAIHGCRFLPVQAENPLLVVGRVAGFDKAVFGLPKESFPLLFEIPDQHLIIATTKLSSFISGRYAPAQDMQTIWNHILQNLGGENSSFDLQHEPIVAPRYNRTEKLPRGYQNRAIKAGAEWILNSQLLVSPSRAVQVEKALLANQESTVRPAPPNKNGDGSLGILEGYASQIQQDGSQLQRLPLRADCNVESAMALAVHASLNGDRRSKEVASNLLNYVYFDSDMCRDVRGDPRHPAFGHIAWGAIAPAWRVANYGDDNARALQATMLAAAFLKKDSWNDSLAKGILANFRTTGKLGFRGDRIDNAELAKNGWQFYRDAETVNYSPHFESGLWACYLWAYRETGYRPFLDKTKTAIAMTMKECPDGWRWGDNMVERARMLLPLAWLVQLEDTREHRQWLMTVAEGLLKRQQPNGAIHEWVTSGANSHYHFPASNEAYGTTETPLIQENGDPASDQLYTTGFALLGLHEAAAATGDATLKAAEKKLAEFLCRIQTRSSGTPWLDGWWFRAFDDRRWEYWASSADAGWGAWSLEAGWAQAWTVSTLGLREMKTSFWDTTRNPDFAKSFNRYRDQMLDDQTVSK